MTKKKKMKMKMKDPRKQRKEQRILSKKRWR